MTPHARRTSSASKASAFSPSALMQCVESQVETALNVVPQLRGAVFRKPCQCLSIILHCLFEVFYPRAKFAKVSERVAKVVFRRRPLFRKLIVLVYLQAIVVGVNRLREELRVRVDVPKVVQRGSQSLLGFCPRYR